VQIHATVLQYIRVREDVDVISGLGATDLLLLLLDGFGNEFENECGRCHYV
jgi:hypothetical protein